MNITQKARRTDLSLNGLAQVLTALNELNFPSVQDRSRLFERKNGGDYMAISNAITEATRTSTHA